MASRRYRPRTARAAGAVVVVPAALAFALSACSSGGSDTECTGGAYEVGVPSGAAPAFGHSRWTRAAGPRGAGAFRLLSDGLGTGVAADPRPDVGLHLP